MFDILSPFENMKRIGEVNLNVINPLGQVNSEILNQQKKILKLKIDNISKFILFHSTDLQNKFLIKLIERLKIAKQKYDNPIIAEDALVVLPIFIQVYENTNNLIKKRDEDKLDELDEDLSLFQTISMEKSLFPSAKEVLKNINKNVLKKEVREIHTGIGEKLHGH